MQLPREFKPPKAPRLPYYQLSGKERDEGYTLYSNLISMQTYAESFAECVMLFHVCHSNSKGGDLWRSWQMIAPQHAIIATYNYRMAMDATFKGLRICRSWSKVLDLSTLEAVKAKFRGAFPHTKELRQTVMHSAERFQNPERKKINQSSKGFDTHGMRADSGVNVIFTGGGLKAETYFAQWSGQLYSIAMTQENIETLISVTGEFFDAFRSLEETPAPFAQ